jgi:hypothetical protein
MVMEVLKLDDLGPDGVRLLVDWDRMQPGQSVFAPCVNVAAGVSQTRKIFARRGWGLRLMVTTKNHVLGLRIWRTT